MVSKIKSSGGCLVALAFSTVTIIAIALYAVLIDKLPFNLGELLALLGVGLVMGALIGQNKPRNAPVLKYLVERVGSFLTCYILIVAISIAYQVQVGEPLDSWTVAGIFFLPAAGGVAGFMVGKDK